MKKFLFYTGVVLVGLFVLSLGAAYLFLDAERLAGALASQVEAQTGLPVQLGRAELALFPMPAAELHQVQVGGTDDPLIAADAIRVSVSPLPLLFGKVAIRTLELDRPRIVVPTNRQGEVELPPGAASTKPTGEEEEKSDAGIALAISRYSLRDASLRYRDWQLENLNAEGGFSLAGSASLRFDADVKDVGALREVEVELEDFRAEDKRWSASGRAEALDLAAIKRRFQPEAEIEVAGQGDLEFQVAADGSRVELNLDAAMIELPGVFRKPDNARLRIEARPEDVSSGSFDGPIRLTLGSDELKADVRGQRLEIRDTILQLSELSRWIESETLPREGEIELAKIALDFNPLRIHGSGNLRAVEVPVAQGVVSLSAPLQAAGSSLELSPLEIQIGDQQATGRASYGLADASIDVELGASALRLEDLVRELRGDYTVGGTMTSALRLEGPPSIDRVGGGGTLEITDGRIKGVSFVRAIFGKLADLGMLIAALKGKDLSKYEEEEFERLSGRYVIRGGKIYFDPLVIEYDYTTADLEGSLAIADGALDLSGKVILSEELQDELTGESKRVEKSVIPIAGIGCTVRKPCIELDGEAVASVLGTLTGSGEIREKLEEHIGKEGVDLLEQILRGGGRR